mmetsp:Transcript_20792/g.79730  ORF Transcript_20792/g.79730 Transcript_20792/m.79730 type:complete len:266 (+) Transcript_20792:205-1002(+)
MVVGEPETAQARSGEGAELRVKVPHCEQAVHRNHRREGERPPHQRAHSLRLRGDVHALAVFAAERALHLALHPNALHGAVHGVAERRLMLRARVRAANAGVPRLVLAPQVCCCARPALAWARFGLGLGRLRNNRGAEPLLVVLPALRVVPKRLVGLSGSTEHGVAGRAVGHVRVVLLRHEEVGALDLRLGGVVRDVEDAVVVRGAGADIVPGASVRVLALVGRRRRGGVDGSPRNRAARQGPVNPRGNAPCGGAHCHPRQGRAWR